MTSESESKKAVETWNGSCHCGKVKFTVGLQSSLYDQPTTTCNCELLDFPVPLPPFRKKSALLRHAPALCPLSTFYNFDAHPLAVRSLSHLCSHFLNHTYAAIVSTTCSMPAYKISVRHHQVPSANATVTSSYTRTIAT